MAALPRSSTSPRPPSRTRRHDYNEPRTSTGCHLRRFAVQPCQAKLYVSYRFIPGESPSFTGHASYRTSIRSEEKPDCQVTRGEVGLDQTGQGISHHGAFLPQRTPRVCMSVETRPRRCRRVDESMCQSKAGRWERLGYLSPFKDLLILGSTWPPGCHKVKE